MERLLAYRGGSTRSDRRGVAVGSAGNTGHGTGKGDTSGIIAIPFQVNSEQEGLCLIDTSNTVICVYELNVRRRVAIELKGARDYTFDLQIRQLNTEPAPDKVRQQVEKLLKKKNK